MFSEDTVMRKFEEIAELKLSVRTMEQRLAAIEEKMAVLETIEFDPDGEGPEEPQSFQDMFKQFMGAAGELIRHKDELKAGVEALKKGA